MTTATATSVISGSDEDAYREFRERLFASRLLVPTGIDGVYLRSERFERIIRGIDALVTQAGAGQATETLHFPLLIPRALLRRTGYAASFPDLAGVVTAYEGAEAGQAELVKAVAGGDDSRWSGMFAPTDLALCSAACHPLYPSQSGQLPRSGRVVEVFGQCFRHEPSLDPARMQVFRQHEFVYLGSTEGAKAHRDQWVDRAEALHRSLGLTVESVVANDPFFGRAGRMLAANQRAEALKIEVVSSICTPSAPTAITSANLHLDHFGAEFGITNADGSVANTSCVGFGVERIALALLHTHGLEVDQWSRAVVQALGL